MYVEIKNYGHDDQKKKLIAGIVLTGGGSQLKHLKQLVEYITGMDTRIGYPNEHLAGDSDEEIASPLYATAVGLLMNALKTQAKKEAFQQEEQEIASAMGEKSMNTNDVETAPPTTTVTRERKSIFDKWSDKLKDFLDNAE